MKDIGTANFTFDADDHKYVNGEDLFRQMYLVAEWFEDRKIAEKERLETNLIILKDEKSFGRTGLDGEILKAQIEYNVFCAYHDFKVMVK